jgi:hypothetical protein
MGRPLRLWQRILVVAWAGFALLAIYAAGRTLLLDQYQSDRLRLHAIPVAASTLYHGWPHDYTAMKGLAMGLRALHEGAGPRSTDELIAFTVAYKPKALEETYYWAADDHGMADYIIAAFYLFGPRAQSLYSFYFVVLGASCLLFLLDAGDHPAMNALLLATLGAIYTCLPVIPLAMVPLPNTPFPPFEPPSLYEPRIIELLAYVGTVHLAFGGLFDRAWTWGRTVAVTLQAALLAAMYQARSSVGWEIGFVAAAGLAAWASHRRSRPLFPIAALILALAAFAVYRHVAYNPRYFQDLGTRTVWHNALMGLGSNPDIKKQYHLNIADTEVIDAVLLHMKDTNDPRLTPAWATVTALNSLGGYNAFNWIAYEQAAKSLYWHLWRVSWREMLHCYLIDKPGEIVRLIVRASTTEPLLERNRRDLYFNPFSVSALIVVLPALVILARSQIALGGIVPGAVGLFAFGLVPGLVFYPVVLTMTGAFASLALTLYLTIAMLVQMLVSSVSGSVRPRSP